MIDLTDSFPEGVKIFKKDNFRRNNEKFRSFKSKENIHKIEVGPYRGFSY